MKYSESLKKNRDFQLVYKQGTSFANRFLVMYVKKNQLGRNRIGISVSKKVGNSVVRHHLARLIRERELGSKRRETVWSLSVVGVGGPRGSPPSTQGPGGTRLRCTGWDASPTAGQPPSGRISAESI